MFSDSGTTQLVKVDADSFKEFKGYYKDISGQMTMNLVGANDKKPLSRGSLKGKGFEDGGGYKVNGTKDGQYFQYYPDDSSHHGGEYYKLSSGKAGTKRYDMYGNLIE